MASTFDLMRSASQAAASGKSVTSDNVEAVASQSSQVVPPTESESQQEQESSEAFAENSTVDSQSADESDLSESSSEEPASSEETPEVSSSAPKKEVITITDDKGRRKVEVDLSDKEQVKKYVQMAYGARKWQAERDREIAAKKQVESQLSEIKQNWDTLEKAFQEGGAEAVVDLLLGKPGSYKEQISRQIQREEFLKNASPEEVEQLRLKEEQDLTRKELEKIRKENEEFRKRMESEKEKSEEKAMEAMVFPVFDKYRFADKLGDANDELLFDKMLWTTVINELGSYEEQGLQLTPELVEKEFSTAAKALRRRINVQADAKASRVIQQKKKEATENVQATVKSGYKTTGLQKEADQLLNNGNLTGLLKNWNKYGSLFNK